MGTANESYYFENQRVMNLSQIKVIVFDFDGVLVESNEIKHQAFKKVFSRYLEYEQKLWDYHFDHPAVPRLEKFKYVVKNIIGLDGESAKKEVELLLKDFEELVDQAVINCEYVVGAEEFLNFFVDKIPMYIASATPKDSLLKILQARGLDVFFKKSYGAPINKAKVLNEIICAESVEASDVLFIGDSPTDLSAALEAGTLFYGRMSDYELSASYCKENLKEILNDLICGEKNGIS